MTDAAISLALLGAVALTGVAYGIRVATRGQLRSERIERGGTSMLLGRDAQEMGYFALQPLARGCVRLGVSANAITAVSLALGAASGVAVGFGHFGLAALLATLSVLGDALDGLVARAMGTASDAGETFDAAVDRYVEFFTFAGLCVYFAGSPAALALTLAALVGSFMVSYSTAKAEALQVEPPRGAMRRAERAVYLTVGIGFVPIAGWVAARLGAPSWLGDLPILLALGLVGGVGNVSAVRRLREIARLVSDRRPAPAEVVATAGPTPAHAEPAAVSSLAR
jgi:CDP-diacylglycerol--glycerol-3-phosphate 3-phosphatidyltransferase